MLKIDIFLFSLLALPLICYGEIDCQSYNLEDIQNKKQAIVSKSKYEISDKERGDFLAYQYILNKCKIKVMECKIINAHLYVVMGAWEFDKNNQTAEGKEIKELVSMLLAEHGLNNQLKDTKTAFCLGLASNEGYNITREENSPVEEKCTFASSSDTSGQESNFPINMELYTKFDSATVKRLALSNESCESIYR